MSAGNFDKGVISFGSPDYALEIQRAEHDGTGNTAVKKSGFYAWDSDNLVWRRVSVDASGQLVISDSFKIPEFDYIDLAYSGVNGLLETVTYKKGGSGGTTVGTLTLSYTGTTLDSVELS